MPEPMSTERLNEIRARELLTEVDRLTGELDRAMECFDRDQRLIKDLQAQVGRVAGRIPCARCGRPILPYDSKTPGNEEMDVCGRCALANAREVAWEERKLWMRALAALLGESGHLLDTLDRTRKALSHTTDQFYETVDETAAKQDQLRAEIADRDTEAQNLRAERDALQAKVARAEREIAAVIATSNEDVALASEVEHAPWIDQCMARIEIAEDIRAALNGDTP